MIAKRLEKAGRRGLAGVARHLVPPVSAGARLPERPEGILVVRPDSRLGNLVLLEPLLRSLVARFSGTRVALLASDRFSGLLISQGYEVIEARKADMASHPWKFPGFCRRLGREGFDVAIDASHPGGFSLSGAVVTGLSRAPVRIGFDAGDCRGWYTHLIAPPGYGMHESEALHALGGLWAGWPGWSRPVLSPPRSGVGRRAAGLHVGASRGKALPFEKLRDIARIVSSRMPLEIYWGTDEEKTLAEAVSEAGGRVMPGLPVPDLLVALAGLSVFVTADNGPMHAASALGVPVVALFRIGNFERYRPLSDGSSVLYDPEGPDPVEAAGRAFAAAR